MVGGVGTDIRVALSLDEAGGAGVRDSGSHPSAALYILGYPHHTN